MGNPALEGIMLGTLVSVLIFVTGFYVDELTVGIILTWILVGVVVSLLLPSDIEGSIQALIRR